mgnify:CR=1 FL=1
MKMSNRLLLIAFIVLVVLMLVFTIASRPIVDEVMKGTIRQASCLLESKPLFLPS